MMTVSTKKAKLLALSILRSRKFFFFIVALLVVQALWMAVTAQYPMAFDEDYHFGIIQIYAQQWSPFITSPPPDSGALGDLVRTPSYLYHYLMSFPYRLITLVTDQQMIQIIFLRFINIALFTGGLIALRKLLLQLRISPGIIHFSLLMIILIPVVPFLAGQINYDNLLFLLVPLISLSALYCARSMRSSGTLPAVHLAALLMLGVLGSLTKYAFLPIFLAVIVYLVWVVAKQRQKWRITFKNLWGSFVHVPRIGKIVVVSGLLIASGLFVERYGVNVVEYGSIQPDCAAVQTVEHCSQYGPWARNHAIAEHNAVADAPYQPAPILFLPEWIGGMMHRLYFAINHEYLNYYELPIPIATAYVVGGVGFLLCIIFARRVFKNKELYLIAIIAVIYVASVLYVNFSGFLNFKTMLAINGRYLILILPFVFALFAIAYSILFRKLTSPKRAASYKLSLAAIVLLLTLQGGGILTFAVRSDSDWYWQTPLAQDLGNGLKEIASPFIVGADHKERP